MVASLSDELKEVHGTAHSWRDSTDQVLAAAQVEARSAIEGEVELREAAEAKVVELQQALARSEVAFTALQVLYFCKVCDADCMPWFRSSVQASRIRLSACKRTIPPY